MPQFYGGRIQLLLPLCLTGDKPELALTIQREVLVALGDAEALATFDQTHQQALAQEQSARIAQLYLLDVLYTEFFKHNFASCDTNKKLTTQAIAARLL